MKRNLTKAEPPYHREFSEYEIPLVSTFILKLPDHTNILSVYNKFNKTYIVCLSNPDEPLIEVKFLLFKVGEYVKEWSNPQDYIGTFQIPDPREGMIVYNLFTQEEIK